MILIKSVPKIKGLNFKDDKEIVRVFGFVMNKTELVDFIKESLPGFSFNDEELKKRINQDKAEIRIKNIFENELKWKERDIEEKMTKEIAEKYFSEDYKRQRNVLKMVQIAYPNIKNLKAVRGIENIKENMLIDIKSGMTTKEIREKYGVVRNTITILKREHKLVSKPRDLTGNTFGSLYVIEKANNGRWICECVNCGDIKYVQTGNLVHGGTKSCGKKSCRDMINK